VGHEIDFTISDFVADVRAPTPSAAAEIVVPKKEELLYQVSTRRDRLMNFMQKRLQQLRLHLGHLSQRVQDPRERARRLSEKFKERALRLGTQMRARCAILRQVIEKNLAQLHALSPLAVIGRGYTITRLDSGVVVRGASDVVTGNRIQTQVADGFITSTVNRTNPGKCNFKYDNMS
jgi:exodeoxyribonuclease VII large subunit